jgi:catechol 2,3-dioxygenase-like lactoylglutathione lyase family enzyme
MPICRIVPPSFVTWIGGTTMLKRVAYVSVFVKDQDKALDFYTNVLGFEKGIDNPTPDGPRFLTVAIKDQDFQLVLWPGTPGQGSRYMAACPPPTRSRLAIARRCSRR